MASNSHTTPFGVPGTPNFPLPPSLVAFNRCLALAHDAIAANDAVEVWGGDPALALFEADAAHAWAMADAAFEGFRFGNHGDYELDEAAWLLTVLFGDNGRSLNLLEKRNWDVRHDAQTCASSNLPNCAIKAQSLWAAADLLEQMIDMARMDSGPTCNDPDDLIGLGLFWLEPDIDLADVFSVPSHTGGPDGAPDPEPDFEPA